MKIMMVRQMNNTLKCAYDSDLETLKKVKLGEFYNVTISQPRNIKFHRKFFALIKLVFDNQEIYTNIDLLRKDLLIEAGFYKEYVNLHGQVIKEPKSISFASMTQTEFNEMYSRILDQIVIHFKFGREEMIENIEQFF